MSTTPGFNKSGTSRRVGLSKLSKSLTKSCRSPINADSPEKSPVKQPEPTSANKYTNRSWKVSKVTPTKVVKGKKVGRNSPLSQLRQQNYEKTRKNVPLLEFEVKSEPDSPPPSPVSCHAEVAYVDLDTSAESKASDDPVIQINSPTIVIQNESFSLENTPVACPVSSTPSAESNTSRSDKKLRKVCRLSLTITPEKFRELRKRKLELSQNSSTPKRQKTDDEKKNAFHKVFDLTEDSEEVSDSDGEESEERLLSMAEVEEKQKILENLEEMTKSNEKTKKLLQQWTDAGIRALQELSRTKDPPIDIGLILDQLNIPHEMYGYQRDLEMFDPDL